MAESDAGEPALGLPSGLGERSRAKIIDALDRNGSWTDLPSAAHPELIVSLVHGTWGTRSPLADETSSFCDGLRDRLDEPVHFSAFRWSGDNSHVARIAASRKLREYVAAVKEAHPAARHYLVCHSHGGNIAFYALRDRETADRVAGVVTISTPFIHATARPMVRGVRSSFSADRRKYWSGVGLLLVSFVVFADVVLGLRDSIAVAIATMAAGACLLVAGFSRRPFLPAIFSDPTQFQEIVSLPTDLGTEILIMRTSADEASGVLSIGSMTAWASTRLLTPLVSWVRSFYRHRWIGPAVLSTMMVCLLVNVVVGYVPAADQAAGQVLSSIGIAGRLLLMFTAAGNGLLATLPLAISFICWVMARPFGSGIGLAIAANLEITAEAAPPGGPWPVYNLILPTRPHALDAKANGLMHSKVYQSRAAIAIMALWIKARRGASSSFVALRTDIDRFARNFRD